MYIKNDLWALPSNASENRFFIHGYSDIFDLYVDESLISDDHARKWLDMKSKRALHYYKDSSGLDLAYLSGVLYGCRDLAYSYDHGVGCFDPNKYLSK